MDILGALQIGGPFGIALAFLGFLVKSYLDKRQDDREEKKSDRESESGIVETTNSALRVVREQMVALGTELSTLREENKRLHDDLTQKGTQINNLLGRVSFLEEENKSLRQGRPNEFQFGPAQAYGETNTGYTNRQQEGKPYWQQ